MLKTVKGNWNNSEATCKVDLRLKNGPRLIRDRQRGFIVSLDWVDASWYGVISIWPFHSCKLLNSVNHTSRDGS